MAKRRIKDRRTIIVRLYTLLAVLALSIVFGGAAYGVWQSEVRVDSISVSGADILLPQTIGENVERSIAGTYAYIFPKDSIFLISENYIRENLTDTYPRIKEVSVSRLDFRSIEVSISERVGVFMWCASATSTTCIASDSDGFLFARADMDLVPVYGSLLADAPEIRNTIFEEGAIPKVSALINALSNFGEEVVQILFRGDDEVVLNFASGPRLEYVLGEEEYVGQAFPSVLESIEEFSEIEYLDMRFGKRVYIKRNE
ncbi:FtsQ-type POTRA domain-containing protein [Candidatus Wolfebacteria bacterium]|nr:FtsQ-type POTRA domain-containing protein [Candidatus Wolfebacteria bacterium]